MNTWQVWDNGQQVDHADEELEVQALSSRRYALLFARLLPKTAQQ